MESSRTPAPRRASPERPGPAGGRREQNRKERTDALLAAGLDLFLERGLEAVTIDDITKRAGIAKGGFYRYFDSKGDLVAALVEPMATDMRAVMKRCSTALAEATSTEDLTDAYMVLASTVAAQALGHIGAVRLFLQEHRAPTAGDREVLRALSADLDRAAIHLSETAVARGLIEVEDPRVSAIAVIGSIEALALRVTRGELDTPLDAIARIVVSMVLDGLRRPPPAM